ncbi:hypothetical protein ACFLVR_03805 [Chloroflexota bacterium]
MLENQDIITTRILAFLTDHFEHWYTANELAAEAVISANVKDIKASLPQLKKDGLIRAKQDNGEWYHQALSYYF